MEQQRHGIEQDRTRLHEEKVRIMEDIGRSEENLKKIEEGFLHEKKKCSTLQGELQEKDSVISDLRSSLSLNEEQLSRVEIECKAKVDEIEYECKMKVTQLENEMHSKDQILCEKRKEYQDNLLQKDEEVRSLSKTVEQLRSYIGEIRPSREVEKLSENNEELTNNLRALTEENNVLTSTMKLLNVRLAAISEIVSIQEAELSRHGGVAGCVRDRQGVLSTWREKVFALMVQLQSQKIVENETKQKETAKFESLNVKFQESERSISILNHKLADQEAAVELEVNKRVKLTEEKEKFLAENDVLKKRQKQWSTQIQALHRSTRTVEALVATTLTCLNKAVGRVASFDQRLKFASSRILFISEFLSHRDSQQKLKTCDAVNQDSQTNSDEFPRENEEHLRSEVQKLLKERTVLLNETKKHNQTLQEKTSALQEHYETMIEEKNIHIEKLQISESENKQRLYSLQEQADTKCQELEEAAKTIEELKLSLSKEKTILEEEHRKAMGEERLKNAQDLAVLEKQLSDARREHTKTVAALRNSERQASREKQQASNMVANIEKEYGERLARVEKRLKDVEKERNLLMVRIREDRSNVVRSRPVSGKDNSVPNGYAVMKKQEKSSEESVAKGKSEASIMQAKDGVERVDTIDAVDALTALKEIKVLSQQIVRLHGKNNEVSASDSEL
ncbi:coiled-coil alpha-helical rod protein 1-like [Dendronephthya gigantea]|uniref:coiled-coil alpha-helical rod protein 1-like n=1 Tax=Dendronephthya gigantea TaxID=151771 RepID=UPI00106D17E0|nr:coiled-coil alpha-helical rod protein 1-like [Dendronephthya gigantea]